MKHTQILKRSWDILWGYRAMWVFGIILALTSASATGGSGGHGGGGGDGGHGAMYNHPAQYRMELSEMRTGLQELFRHGVRVDVEPWIIWLAVGLAVLALLLAVVFTIGHFVSRVAMIRMVDGYETNGEKLTWKQGFRLGWSRAAWRLFLINLLILLAVIAAFAVLFGLAALPAILTFNAGEALMVMGMVVTAGLSIPLALLAIVTVVVISLAMETIRRVCVLGEHGVLDSIRLGWKMVRGNLKDVGLMWLLTLGIQFGLVLLLIPLVIALLGGGLALGGGFGLLLYLAVQALSNATAGWITAAIGGIVVLITTLAIPLTFVDGLKETYLSSAWTLTYRELSKVESQ